MRTPDPTPITPRFTRRQAALIRQVAERRREIHVARTTLYSRWI
ncbi:MAG TPA: hypothetical protein VK063_13840 [Beutenbergiaceae bacterium]|nr:hypothetical protein [Beutenbergiaceae bacterium]